MRRAVFLDRDGVINEEVEPVCKEIKQFKFFKTVNKAIKLLNDNNCLVIIVTNQPAIAKGFCKESEVRAVNDYMKKELLKKGAMVDAIYYCPHHPAKGFEGERPELKISCDCRKPKTGMLKKAKKDFDLELKKCFLVGDQTADIKCGNDAGCKTILVRTGYAGKDGKYNARPDYECENLYASAKLIIEVK